MTAVERGASEPAASVSHLLVAADVLRFRRWEGTYVAVCGAVIQTATAGDDPRYCRKCVRATVRWSSVGHRSGYARFPVGRLGGLR